MAGPQGPELNNLLRALSQENRLGLHGHRGTPSAICIKSTRQTPHPRGGQGQEGCPLGSAGLVSRSPHSTERIPFCVTFNFFYR